MNNYNKYIGKYYIENNTSLIWKLVDIQSDEIELENYDTTYHVHIDEFEGKFNLLRDIQNNKIND